MTSTDAATAARAATATTATGTAQVDDPALRPLAVFAGVALPTGWLLLSAYQVLDLPSGPFVLLTLALGLVLPMVLLVRRDPHTDGRRLLRDAFRWPRPGWLLLPALLAIPGLTALLATWWGVGVRIDGPLIADLAVNVVSSVVIVNLWEELAWTGFVQRRAMARWGLVAGSLATAGLFAGIHLPLAFDGADGADEVLTNVALLLGAGAGLRLLVAGLDVWSGRSLLSVAVLHASFNAAAGVVQADHDLIRYAVTGALGLLVLATPVRRAYSPPVLDAASNHVQKGSAT